jgi:hypothetical protein
MRAALVVTTVFLMLLGLHPLLAQDQGRPSVSAPQPAQAQTDSWAKQVPNLSDEDQKRRTMERLGPGVDWDHRKPGRDWQISPRRENGEAKGDRD